MIVMESNYALCMYQGSLHYTPEHCLVNGGVPLFWWNMQHVSNGCEMNFF